MRVKSEPAEKPYSCDDDPRHPRPVISTAVDEIYYLRALAAEIAASLEEDLALASLPASVRRRHERLLAMTAKATVGEVIWHEFDAKGALKRAGLPDVLSNEEWAANQHVGTVDRERP